MADLLVVRGTKYSISKIALSNYLNWLVFAVTAFLCVIMVYQLFLGTLSYLLGYETHVYFGKVDSFPQANKFWSSNRVMIMYALPPFLLLIFSAFFFALILFSPGEVNRWKWFAYWIAVFATLLGTSLMCLAPVPALSMPMSTFQGFAVVVSWFQLGIIWPVVLISISCTINIVLGYICSPVLIKLSPSSVIVKKDRRGKEIIMHAFLYPVILVAFVAFILSYPRSVTFFIIFFLQVFFWLPGLYSINPKTLTRRGSRGTPGKPTSNYLLFTMVIIAIVVIRIFFS